MTSVQYRVVYGKEDEVVEGPDDADIVISVAVADANQDPTVAYMQGKLKATGDTGALFDLLKSGAGAEVLGRLSRRA